MTYHQVHQMDRDKFSIKKIAEFCGMNWRTVKRILEKSEQDYLSGQEKVQDRNLNHFYPILSYNRH